MGVWTIGGGGSQGTRDNEGERRCEDPAARAPLRAKGPPKGLPLMIARCRSWAGPGAAIRPPAGSGTEDHLLANALETCHHTGLRPPSLARAYLPRSLTPWSRYLGRAASCFSSLVSVIW